MLQADALNSHHPSQPRAPHTPRPAAAAPPPTPPTPPRPPTPPTPGPLSLVELRALRRETQQKEADLSYLRRLLQGRIDILQAELARRSAPGLPVPDTPGPDGQVLDRLP